MNNNAPTFEAMARAVCTAWGLDPDARYYGKDSGSTYLTNWQQSRVRRTVEAFRALYKLHQPDNVTKISDELAVGNNTNETYLIMHFCSGSGGSVMQNNFEEKFLHYRDVVARAEKLCCADLKRNYVEIWLDGHGKLFQIGNAELARPAPTRQLFGRGRHNAVNDSGYTITFYRNVGGSITQTNLDENFAVFEDAVSRATQLYKNEKNAKLFYVEVWRRMEDGRKSQLVFQLGNVELRHAKSLQPAYKRIEPDLFKPVQFYRDL